MDTGTIPGIDGYVDRDYFTPEIFINNTTPYVPSESKTYTDEYIVERGDTLSQIALEFNTTVEEIAKLNDIENVNLIYPGENLKIIKNTSIESTGNHLGHTEYRIKYGDTLSEIAIEFNTTVENLAILNNIKNVNLIYAGDVIKIRN